MSVEIFIARHGQNEDNANGILNGHRDLPLTDIGRSQARALGESIKEFGLSFDAIYASPLSRALETAEIVASLVDGPTPIIHPGIIERNFGIMTGERIDDIEQLCGPNIIKADPITYFVSVDGAETFPELVERGHKVLADIRTRHKSGRVLLVCHGDIGKMIYAAATGKDWRDVLLDFHFGNGELIDISDTEKAHVVTLAQFNH